MTNNQALVAANYCGILYGSKQITFGVANRLATNAKIYQKIQEEIESIKARGAERKEENEVIAAELNEFGKAQFEGTFKTIDLAVIEGLAYEEIPVTITQGEAKVQQNWLLSDMLIYLTELEIIK